MDSPSKKKQQILRKVISKTRRSKNIMSNSDHRMTRFKTRTRDCSICYSSIEIQGVLNSCNHDFCFGCIEKWSKTENTCPLCKKRFSGIKKIWNRPYYGDKHTTVSNSNTREVTGIQEESKEVQVPNRDQAHTREQERSSGGITIISLEQVVNIMLSSLPHFPGAEDTSIEILLQPQTTSTTPFLPISFDNFFDFE